MVAIECESCQKKKNDGWFRICLPCHEAEKNSSLDDLSQSESTIEELQSTIEELQLRLNFLRLQFDNEQGDEFPTPDVLLDIIGNKEGKVCVYAHKLILAGRSPVFRKMLEAEMLEKETGVIRIEDATFPVVRAVIKFCYTAQINFSGDVTSEEVLEVAHKYAIDGLCKVCEDHLAKLIDNTNLPRMLKIAKKFEAKSLQAAASAYFKENFDKLIDAVVDEGF